jgi:hypothetical protein
MVVPCAATVAWLWRISQYPHGSIFGRGWWPRAGREILFNYVNQPRKKLISKLNVLFHFFQYRLKWAKKVSLAAICLVAGSTSFGLREN